MVSGINKAAWGHRVAGFVSLLGTSEKSLEEAAQEQRAAEKIAAIPGSIFQLHVATHDGRNSSWIGTSLFFGGGGKGKRTQNKRVWTHVVRETSIYKIWSQF